MKDKNAKIKDFDGKTKHKAYLCKLILMFRVNS